MHRDKSDEDVARAISTLLSPSTRLGDFLHKGRLSPKLVSEELRLPLHPKRLVSSPVLNPIWKELKFTAEGISLNPQTRMAEVAHSRQLIESAIGGRNIATRTEFAARCNWTYKKISKSPYSTMAFLAAGLRDGRPDYWYWEDDEIVAAATTANSFTALHYRDSLLRAHLAGRQLCNKVICANPQFASHVRIGYGDFKYRSEPELIIGNLLFLNNITCEREPRLWMQDGRYRQPDFVFAGCRILELSQNTTGDRGSRRAGYATRDSKKRRDYGGAQLEALFVVSDHFYDHGSLQVPQFAQHVRERILAAFHLDIGPIPPAAELLFERNDEKRVLLQESAETVLRFLSDRSIVSIAELQNKNSWMMTCLRARDDGKEILQKLKRRSLQAGVDKAVATRARNRGEWSSIAGARALCAELSIRSQREFFIAARTHGELFKGRRVPRNPAGVYGRMGVWVSWPDLLCHT